MSASVTLNQVLELTKNLPTLDKIRLIEKVAPQIERELKSEQSAPRQSLRGLWRGIDISAEGISQMRKEMWKNFPREDI